MDALWSVFNSKVVNGGLHRTWIASGTGSEVSPVGASISRNG